MLILTHQSYTDHGSSPVTLFPTVKVRGDFEFEGLGSRPLTGRPQVLMFLYGDFLVKGHFGSDVVPLGLDPGVVFGDSSKFDQGLEGFPVTTLGGQPSRRKWDEEDGNAEEDGREDL